VNAPRHYTEHSPVVVEMRERLFEEWMRQKSERDNKPPYRPSSQGVQTVMTKAALMCVRGDIDPVKLVAAALRNGEHATYATPNLLLDVRTLHIMNNNTGVDDDGNEHRLISTHEANYRAEWAKARELLRVGTPVEHVLDPVNGLRPLIRWALATKVGVDASALFFEAAAEYRSNRVDADTVFGDDFFKGLR
jgi:hypothetical protein